MIDATVKYREALAAFAAPGGRWAHKGALTYWGKAAGLSADEIIADARAAGVVDRDADIRSGWADARPRFVNGRPSPDYVPRAKPKPPPSHPRHVRELLAGTDTENAGIDGILELSPCLDWIGQPERMQTAAFLGAAFDPDEMLFVFRDAPPTVGKPGVSMRTAAEWLKLVERRFRLPGDHIVPNPFSGEQGATTDGRPSFVAQSCLAAFPFLIVEFDAMPLPMQCAFWRAFLLRSSLAPALLSLTFSGNKSIHGLIHAGCRTLQEWEAVRSRFVSLFASDADAIYRADPQAMRPRTGTRIPGVRRCDNGSVQQLLYLNPSARRRA